MANSFVFLGDLNLASVLLSLRCDFSGFWRHVKNWGELIGFGHAPPSCKENPVSLPIEDLGHHRLFLEQVTETTSGILDFGFSGKNTKR
ncbi:hypothetical protein Bca4012_007175 [Brassica carinata]